jgi:allophanate hydrolase
VLLAVVGAHLRGQPLHLQLVEAGARFVASTSTSDDYRLYALPATEPRKPGLVRVGRAAVDRPRIRGRRRKRFGLFVFSKSETGIE